MRDWRTQKVHINPSMPGEIFDREADSRILNWITVGDENLYRGAVRLHVGMVSAFISLICRLNPKNH